MLPKPVACLGSLPDTGIQFCTHEALASMLKTPEILPSAERFLVLLPCRYTLAVISGEAWRINSWITLRSSPPSPNKVAKLCRNVCQPMVLVIPAAIAAGRT